ncbi:MAG: response regulator [Desulforhopalus sp.]|nr:response regulator [Desulforhopalus sp.]
MEPTTVLVIDDDQSFTEILGLRLDKRGFTVCTAADGEAGLTTLDHNEGIDVVVLDLAMPGMDGLEVLKIMKKRRPLVEILMLTGRSTVTTAVEAIKLGAYNYLTKPCNIEDLSTIIEEAAKHRKNRQAKILEIRMTPYLSPQKREELIGAILKE